MERRKALKLTATVLGGSIIGAQVFLAGCTVPKERAKLLKEDDVPLLDEISETILPNSEQSPGAKAAQVGAFMKSIVNDCYSAEESAIFIKGLDIIDKAASSAYDKIFLDLSAEQRLELLSTFVVDATKSKLSDTPHFFSMMKELTILGYFTSEPGATKALRYNPIPGRFEGCIPYRGETSWAL